MKKIRCTLLCLLFVFAVSMMTGCRNNRDNMNYGSSAVGTSGARETTSAARESTSAAWESSGAVRDTSHAYESSTGDMTYGVGETTREYENGAGSRATEEGTSMSGTQTDGTRAGGLTEDLTDALDDVRDDLTRAARTR